MAGKKRKRVVNKEEEEEVDGEDWCFQCKEGGKLTLCDFKQCMKAYHPECVKNAKNRIEPRKRWICDWHYCNICKKSSAYRCFVCKYAVCRKCIKKAEFVQVRGKHGFCEECLEVALLIENEVDVDSNGRKIDFDDIETCEALFKEYWEIIKAKEGLTSVDVRSANILLKKGECFTDKRHTYKVVDDQDFDESMEGDVESCEETRWRTPRKHAKKDKQKTREFMGWGSKSLIDFLKSIGKDSIDPISQYDMRHIIVKYINENKLTHPDKKKTVLCDMKLQSIFGKKTIKINKIYDLLERHLVENLEQPVEDDYSCDSDEKDEDTIKTCERQTRRKDEKENVVETRRSCFASITEHNIKLIYLKRTLIEDFLMTPETFDDKVIGSFVRVKYNSKDFRKSPHLLLQVTGTTKAQGIENITGEVTLQLSNMKKDIPISMLSDDNFFEEEIEELHQRVKNGLLKRLTIVELERKARRLHEDITEHWIKKELILLQKLIDQANEKGWRREFHEYFDKKDLLQTPSEKQRLLRQIPKVIAEKIETEVNSLDLPKDEQPIKDSSPQQTFLPRDSVSADDLAATEDVIIVDDDIEVTHDSCKIERNGEDTDNRTNETLAEGTEAAITVNTQVTPETSVIEVSGDKTNKRATESTSGAEDAIIANADMELMPDISLIEVKFDDSVKRAAEKIAEGVEDAFGVNSKSEVMLDSSMIEVHGSDSDKKAAEMILEGTEDVIMVDADIEVTDNSCKIEVNGDDTDNRTDETLAEGIEAAVNIKSMPELSAIDVNGDQANKRATESTSGTEDVIIVTGDDTNDRTDETLAEGIEAAVNAKSTPELSAIEVSGDQANKRATESTSGIEDAIIASADIEFMPDVSVMEVNFDDSDKRAAEKIAEKIEDVFGVKSKSEVMPDSSMIEVDGCDSDTQAAKMIPEGNTSTYVEVGRNEVWQRSGLSMMRRCIALGFKSWFYQA